MIRMALMCQGTLVLPEAPESYNHANANIERVTKWRRSSGFKDATFVVKAQGGMRVNTISRLWKGSVQGLQCVKLQRARRAPKDKFQQEKANFLNMECIHKQLMAHLVQLCEFIREGKYTCVLLHLNGVVKPKIVATGMVASKLQPDVAPP
jgi:hypothetical protein